MPTKRYSPPNDEVAAHIDEVVELFEEQQAVDAKYRKALARVTDKETGDAVPIAHMAERLGVERKTVYRHLGRPMT